MPEFVRVRDNATGHHLSLPKSMVDANASAYSVLKQDATDPAGNPLPPVYKTESAAAGQKKES